MFRWPLILLFTLSSFYVLGQEERDLEIWNKNRFQVNPGKNIVIDVAEKIQYSKNSELLRVKYAELYVGHIPVKWLKYGVGYRLVDYNQGNGIWLRENRPMLFANLNKKVNNFGFVFSNRFECRTFMKAENHFRYRQSFRVNFPSITNWGMNFYLSEETFIKFNSQRLHLARFYSGLKAVTTKCFDLNFYYALQKIKSTNDWYSGDVLGLDLHFRI
ncbi:MAG: DUF2490 domain-containing protein [Draconibacterium sp.]